MIKYSIPIIILLFKKKILSSFKIILYLKLKNCSSILLLECLDKLIYNLIKDRNEKILNNLVLLLKEIFATHKDEFNEKETSQENREKILDSVQFFDTILIKYFRNEFIDFQTLFYSLIVFISNYCFLFYFHAFLI